MKERQVRQAAPADRDAWLSLDRHIDPAVLERKLRDREGYVLEEDGRVSGVLRWNLFWDSVPFCTLLFLSETARRQGGGTLLMERWEKDMRAQCFPLLMVSTQADEEAQHFYRKLGYRDAGGFVLQAGGLTQPLELIMTKEIGK